MEIGEPHAISGDPIDARREALGAGPVGSEITPAPVVAEDDHDIGRRPRKRKREGR